MKPRNKSLHDKPVQKVTLEEGQQVTGKVIGLKDEDKEKIKLLLDTEKELMLITIKMSGEIKKLERGKHVILKAHKQGLKIETAQTQAMNTENIKRTLT